MRKPLADKRLSRGCGAPRGGCGRVAPHSEDRRRLYPRFYPRFCRWDLQRLAAAALAAFLLLAPAGLTGCAGKDSDPPTNGRTAAAEAEWAWLQQAKKTVDAKRLELAQAPPATQDAKRKEVAALGEELDRRLIDFINAHPPTQGEKPAGRLLDAIRMKSGEDVALAHQFIEQGGDYRRAIEIYEAALAIDPDNPRLRQELESARAHRYMTADRFAQVKKGMTQDEVRSLLGPPNVRDIRDFPERGVTAWFYTKDADGRAAAVWFSRESGTYAVYLADFDAVEPHKDAPAAPKPAS